MNRRGSAWIVIICILVVGVSVTKMTKKFVSSDRAEGMVFAGKIEETAAAQAIVYEAEAALEDGEASENGVNAESVSEPGDMEISAVEEEADKLWVSQEAISDSDMSKKMSSGNDPVTADAGAEAPKAYAETVKSPLDPAIGETAASSSKEYTYDELLERLETAEAQSEIYRSALNDATPGSIYIAAEQDWNLWDKELNILYTAIRSKMSDEEAEDLKRKEIEWIKERDLEADKGMLKSKNQPGQNTDYIRISAARTRERCYELISCYEEILKRTEEAKTQKVPQ